MYVIRLTGGLGNQLFQYALGRRLSLLNDVPLKLDISAYAEDRQRTYDLKHFNICENFASPTEVADMIGGTRLMRLMRRTLDRFQPYYRRVYVHHTQTFCFDPNMFRVRKHVYLYGTWQSEKYFTDIAEEIREDLSVKTPPDEANTVMARTIHNLTAVSVHVRRGDYVTNPTTHKHHGVCPPEYYQAAIARIAQSISQIHLFVFSDDPAWAKDNLHFDYPATYLEHNGPDKSYEDLRLLSLCQHHVIANSSFSWWGAWLCTNPHKIVVAPQTWFSGFTGDTRDLVPETWIRL